MKLFLSLFIFPLFVFAQDCSELVGHIKKLQNDIVNNTQYKNNCSGLSAEKVGSDAKIFNQYHCQSLPEIDLALIKAQHELALFQGLEKLRDELVDGAGNLTPITSLEAFSQKLSLAAGIEMGMENVFNKAQPLITTDMNAVQALTKICKEETKDPFCAHFKNEILNSQTNSKEIIAFLPKWKKEMKENLQKSLKITSQEKPISLSEVWTKLSEEGIKSNDLSKPNKKLYQVVKDLKLEVDGADKNDYLKSIVDIKGDIKNLKNTQVQSILKESLDSLDDRNTAELKNKLSLSSRLIKDFPQTCLEMKLVECKMALDGLKSTDEQTNALITALRGHLQYESEQKTKRANCQKSKAELDKCIEEFGDKTLLNSKITALEDLKEQRSVELVKPQNLLKLVLLQYEKKQCAPLKSTSIAQADCDFINSARSLKPIKELTLDIGEVVLKEYSENDQDILPLACPEGETDEFYKKVCRQYKLGDQRPKPEIIPVEDDEDEDIKPVTSVKAPTEDKNNRQAVFSELGTSIQNLWNTYQNNRYNNQFQQPFYPSPSPYSNPYTYYGGNQGLSDSIISQFSYFGGYGQYYNVSGGSNYSTDFGNYYGLSPLGTFDRNYDYNLTTEGSNLMPLSPLSGFNFGP
jgi:hypothetical protein